MTTGNGDRSTGLGDLAERHRTAGRVAEAVAVLRQGVGAARADLGDSHPVTTRMRARLTRLLIDLGRDAEAAELEAGTLDGDATEMEAEHDGR